MIIYYISAQSVTLLKLISCSHETDMDESSLQSNLLTDELFIEVHLGIPLIQATCFHSHQHHFFFLQSCPQTCYNHITQLLSCSCSHQGPLAGSTPEPSRRYTLSHPTITRTASAPSPSVQRRISSKSVSTPCLKNKGRKFNILLKKGEKQTSSLFHEKNNQISDLSQSCQITSLNVFTPV